MKKKIIVLIISCFVSFLIGDYSSSENSYPLYSKETGDPINCRALIESNISGVQEGHFSCEDAMHSINRNCGGDGYSW